MANQQKIYRPNWAYRRAVIFGSLLFCAGGVGYLIVFGADLRLHEDIASGLILLAGSIIGSYVFGAAYDDRNVMRHGTADPAPAVNPQGSAGEAAG